MIENEVVANFSYHRINELDLIFGYLSELHKKSEISCAGCWIIIIT